MNFFHYKLARANRSHSVLVEAVLPKVIFWRDLVPEKSEDLD
jgi:hypothetical protein